MNMVTILIKPSSSICSANCKYCFYKDVSIHREIPNYGWMEKQCMENIIDKALHMKEVDEITFAFQGGEPLLIGITYYYDFINLVKSKNKNKVIHYTLQTNALLLDKEYCRLFKEHNFLLGISLDGIRKTNNMVRFTKRGSGSFDEVFHKIKVLESYQIQFNIITVLSSSLYSHAQEIYSFYKKNRWKYIQIIPCLASFDETDHPYACTPNMFKEFYTTLFHLWLKDLRLKNYMSIQLFDDIIRVFRRQVPLQCGFSGTCARQCVIESNGDMYPCDFYVLDEYRIGNVDSIEILQAMISSVSEEFINEEKVLSKHCNTCKFLAICNGGCKRQRHTFLSEEECGLQHIYSLFLNNYNQIEQSLSMIREVN